jgi:23S rRNA (uracil1939-C5)-methyltransferase
MIGQVKSIGKGGQGIVMSSGKPVFIDRVLPGETVEYTITGKRHSVWFGSLRKIIEASKDRVDPPCGYYSRCGGCNFQHIAYPVQMELKKNILTNNLKKISGIQQLPRICPFTSPAFGYRTKSVLKVRNGKIGFLQKGSHRIVEIDKCLLMPGEGKDWIPVVRNHPRTKKTMNGDIMGIGNEGEFSALLKEGRSKHFLTEKKEIRFKVKEFSYRFTPDNFIQANRFTLGTLIELVQNQITENLSGHAIDLYSGTGFFTIPLSRGSEEVTAYDHDPANLGSLLKNLEANGISNVSAWNADIRTVSLPESDLVLADPPRAGLNRHIIRQISRPPVKRIIYFSCDSATFSRDISAFYSTGYQMADLALIDNFPQTDHFEIFCLLVNTGKK